MNRRNILLGLTSAGAVLGTTTDASAGSFAGGLVPEPMDPTLIDPRFDSRAVNFENPTGARGQGGKSGNGRKGRPAKSLEPGATEELANIGGSGTIRHFWATVDGWTPPVLRALRLEIFYDGRTEPSVSVPLLDFFGQPHGRQAAFDSALLSAHEGRGLNCYLPIPFRRGVRVTLVNESKRHVRLFYQIDYTLEPAELVPRSYLHASFNRQNPTVMRQDFVIVEGLKGPGRFIGCSVGVRILDTGRWYGEGEVKIYRDGDTDYPTICGTGLEDYACSAWGLGAHHAQYAGAPLVLPAPGDNKPDNFKPDFVGFYRWHLPDPVMFSRDLKVTIQQIGFVLFDKSQEDDKRRYAASHPQAGEGWMTVAGTTFGLAERVDDYCATAFVYCSVPQTVPRYLVAVATADLALLPYESKPDLTDDQREYVARLALEQAKARGPMK